ncbi:glucose-6-phosphatase 2-like [Liolophura sinensis]|uniref:glucose-6-phosphatase 2-like n=1 Tax=Liolophura sinensis TaxID=3198878 RepID=UPI003158420F
MGLELTGVFTMDQIHHHGLLMIQYLQVSLQPHSKFLIWISHLSSPAWSYTVYFPLSYYLHKSVGRRVLLVASVAEWLNAVLKWILHGERPYWWGHEAGMCQGNDKPCNQFYITCETGPGSPSGHCMVTISVFCVMVSALLFHIFKNKSHRTIAGITLWTAFGILTSAINISRCFIFAHFPHQVLLGTVVGILTAMCFDHISMSSLSLRHYLTIAVGMLLVAAMTYMLLIQMGLDPHWSISKAKKWCAHEEWVHLTTTLFFSVAKASSSLVGLGLAETINNQGQNAVEQKVSKLISMIFALVFTCLLERVNVAQDSEFLFYLFCYIKYIIMIFVIAAVVPWIVTFFTVQGNRKTSKDKLT